MLRIIIISLFVANLLLFGFQGDKPADKKEAAVRQAVVEDSNMPTIHLFNELMEDQGLMNGNRQCFSLGPFHSIEDRDETRALLLEVSADISERQTQALVEKGYWVYLPPYASLLEANEVLMSLKALGLKDIAVIYDGEWEKAISAGYFLRQGNALRRKKGLEDRGYAPLIRVQRQSESRYWLDFEQNPGSGLITIDMQDRPNDFMQRSMPCAENNPFEVAASASENLVAETKQPKAQKPEEDIQPPPKESKEPQPVENIEQEPVVSNEPQPEESTEPQQAEGDGAQSEDGDGSQPTEETALDPEESIDTAPENGVEASDNLADDTSQQQAEENVDGTSIDSGEAVPEPDVETEPENSIGTGPVISFGTEPEESVETESEDGGETVPEDGDETESEDGDETEPEGGDETEPDDG